MREKGRLPAGGSPEDRPEVCRELGREQQQEEKNGGGKRKERGMVQIATWQPSNGPFKYFFFKFHICH